MAGRNKLLIALAALIVLASGLYTFRLPILLNGLTYIAKKQRPVLPNQDIAWAQGLAEPSEGGRPPNIIVILVDDMGFNDLTTYGGGVARGTVPTPAIDALAADGVIFGNGYAGNAVCAPSRASLLTGRYSTRFGFEFTPTPGPMLRLTNMMTKQSNNLRPAIYDSEAASAMPEYEEMGMPSSEVTIAELLKDRGYHTMHIGKWHLGRTEEFRPTSQGFDESLLMDSLLYLPEDDPDVVNAKQDFDPIDRFLWKFGLNAVSFNNSDRFQTRGYMTDYFTEEAVKAIEANANNPFFLYLAHWGVHTPLQASKADYDALSHIENHRLRVYAAMVRSLDRSVAKIDQVLKDKGLYENTLVIFTSDNGGAGYIGLPEINTPYRGWKLTLYEGGTHVPFFARWPGVISEGTEYDQPISHIDILPTIASAAGVELPTDRKIDGVNLLPFLKGENDGTPHDVVIWREGYYQAVLANGWKLQVSDLPEMARLYHLRDDPTEQADVADQYPDKITELKSILAAHNAEQVEPLWPNVVQIPVSIDKTSEDPQSPDDEYIYWPN